MMRVDDFKFAIDPLYGRILLDSFLAQLIVQPEVQRLREVRLSNINSFLMAGCANISRFEHSLGTAYLAQQLAKKFHLDKRDRCHLICAALLHDVAITPFGHLMEEAFRYAGMNFNHEKRLEEIFLGEKEFGNIDMQIYRGKTVGFRKVLNLKEYRQAGINANGVFALKKGLGPLGQLINGTIDLDNIDNVCRMAYHIGVGFRKNLPMEIIEGFFIREGILCYDITQVALIEEWESLRERLYNILMTNPLDFSAKSMLIEAIRIGLTGTASHPPILNGLQWKLTDAELMSILQVYEPTVELIDRLQIGHLYDFIGLFWVDIIHLLKNPSVPEIAAAVRKDITTRLNCNIEDIIIYIIKDKRTRLINNIAFRNRGNTKEKFELSIGKNSTQILLGISTARRELVTKANESICVNLLEEIAGQGMVTICEPILNMQEAMSTKHETDRNQLGLF